MAVEKVVFGRDVYGLQEIKKAAYRFIDKFSIDIELSDSKIECSLNFLKSDQSDAFWVDEFKLLESSYIFG
jgi:hypothetical protein